MTIVSIQSDDKSNFLCKRFAMLASSFFDDPKFTLTPTAQVPLENLFRVLEMFYNDSFSDENRRGVLALESPNSLAYSPIRDNSWHTEIESAVRASIAESFGQSFPEKDAARELQSTLRTLIVDGAARDQAASNRAKKFFVRLGNSL